MSVCLSDHYRGGVESHNYLERPPKAGFSASIYLYYNRVYIFVILIESGLIKKIPATICNQTGIIYFNVVMHFLRF